VLLVLIKHGASCGIADIDGALPLHYATVVDENIPPERAETILHVLLKEGVSSNSVDSNGRTPLLWAASNGNFDKTSNKIN
jgi:ankyrin repeat protein